MRYRNRASFAYASTITSGHLFLLLSLLFTLCFAAGCHKSPATQASQPQPAPDTNPAAAIDKGDLKLSYQPRSKPAPTHSVGSNPQALAGVIANLNERVALPWDIVISSRIVKTRTPFMILKRAN